MENILLVGVNTRAVACSLKSLGYKVYSADYFGTKDLRSRADHAKSVLDQKPHISCGKFSQRFNPQLIREMALEMVNEVDGIISCAGSSPSWFPSKKIIGNQDVGSVEDKFSLYQKLKKHFLVPETYLPVDIYEAAEIARNEPGKKFILKPRSGAGGYGVRIFNDHDLEGVHGLDGHDLKGMSITEGINSNDWIMQEFIDGENISASVLSNEDEARTILTSTQIIGDTTLGQKEPFGYCGNMVPYTGDMKISEIASKVVAHLSLIGSNGVDFILKNGELYVIEVNPRLQGTFECAELSLDTNMAHAHLEACQGHLMEVPPPSRFAVKMVVHAGERSQVGNLNFSGVCDLPFPGVIIEKGEPMVTVLSSGNLMEDTLYSARKTIRKVYSAVNFHAI
ncbi:ATP-grasp domain-containing protein [uncultured Methanobacterium sp.]|uniref:ATP-grasp domain-containing protein n=1 Tax=uncultured Methanobacterium sp. TaxID=176306 RepID=UPI002AA74F42|nr:ATP-grasp domain-containing protein [uncultured Methanobacterium sp.]